MDKAKYKYIPGLFSLRPWANLFFKKQSFPFYEMLFFPPISMTLKKAQKTYW